MCAPAPVTPPANALEVEQELMLELIEKIHNYRPSDQKIDVDDTINSALDNFCAHIMSSILTSVPAAIALQIVSNLNRY